MTTELQNELPNDEETQPTGSAELLKDLAKWKEKARTAEAAVEAVQATADEWRKRWYAEAVEKPLSATLAGLSPLPAQYVQDGLTQYGVLAMEDDDDGVTRPVWKNSAGTPVEIADDDQLYKHLVSLVDNPKFAHGAELAKLIRGCGATGGGALPSSGSKHAESKKPEPPKRQFALGVKHQ